MINHLHLGSTKSDRQAGSKLLRRGEQALRKGGQRIDIFSFCGYKKDLHHDDTVTNLFKEASS